ncbi:MAG: lipid-A-disaccharide synthase [Spirochaetota bacterium]
MSEQKFLIVTGEPSGDLLGASLMQEMRKDFPGAKFYGIGGEAMSQEGLDSLTDIEAMTVIGFAGILRKYRFLKSLANRLVQLSKQENISHAILIDYPGFNLRLAEMLDEMGVKIVFYVSPQIWAWRFKRVYFIQKHIGLMLTLFSFEKEIYEKHAVNAKWVGHPLLPRLEKKIANPQPLPLVAGHRIITLMPGSRTSEITRLLPILLQTAQYLQNLLPEEKFHFLIPGISKKNEDFIVKSLEDFKEQSPHTEVFYHFDRSAECIQAADLVILASGTATLEVTALQKPMIITYQTGFLTYHIGVRVKQTKHIGMVNILAGDTTVCKEFLQKEAKADKIATEAKRILTDTEYRENMLKELSRVKSLLGDTDPSQKASKFILEWMQADSPDE